MDASVAVERDSVLVVRVVGVHLIDEVDHER